MIEIDFFFQFFGPCVFYTWEWCPSIEKSSKEEKQKKKMESVECYNCGKRGHYVQKCPEQNKPENSDAEPFVGFTEDTSMHQVSHSKDTVMHYEVILDSGSQVNIMHPNKPVVSIS